MQEHITEVVGEWVEPSEVDHVPLTEEEEPFLHDGLSLEEREERRAAEAEEARMIELYGPHWRTQNEEMMNPDY